MHNVLLVAHLNSHLPELFRVANCLANSQRFRPVLLYAGDEDPIHSNFIKQWTEAGFSIIDRTGKAITAPLDKFSTNARSDMPLALLRSYIVSQAQNKPALKRFLDWLYRSYREITVLPRTLRHRRQTRRLLLDLSIQLVILPEENVGYQSAMYVNAAHELGRSSVVVPYTIANATEAAEHAINNPRLFVRGPWRKFIARLYPRWVYKHHGRRLLLQPSCYILTAEWLKLAPPDPWMINSGSADAITVESQIMMNYYLNNGIPAKRLALTGSVSDDLLASGLRKASKQRQALDLRAGLDPKKPLLLCAFPPPWFPRPSCDFSDFRSLIDFWLESLRLVPSCTVALHLHPRIQPSDEAYISQAGFPIIHEDIPSLIPLCDLYLASISATIRWAIACGKPVINYDVYKYRFNDYDTAPGVMTVERRDDFRNILRVIEADSKFLSSMAEKQRTVSHNWGVLDGRSQQRLLDLFGRLSNQTAAPHENI